MTAGASREDVRARSRLSTKELVARHAPRLRAELVRLLYASSGIALITTPLASITLAVIGSTRTPFALVAAWLGYVLAVAVFRAAIVRRYRRLPPEAVDVTAWSRRFVAGAAGAGLGWGVAGILFFSGTSAAWQMFLALVLAGVAMAGVPVLAPAMGAFLAFTIPTLLPITARFLLEGGATGLAVGALGVVFGGGLAASAWRMHQAIVGALVLAFENHDLVSELSVEVAERGRAEAGLREARDELEVRVRERTEELQRLVVEQKRTEESLRTLIEASPLAIVELDLHGTVRTWNRAAHRMFGWSEREVLGERSPIVPADMESEYRSLLAGKAPQQLETRRKRKDGSLVDVVLSVAPLLDAHGQLTGTIVMITDITERKQLELQLRESQKMEAVGRLAGGIAHDFNNLLTVIIGRSDIVLSSLEPSNPTRWDVELIETTAQRAAVLTRQLLAFSRRQVLQPKVLSLHEVVDDVMPMLRRLIGEDIEIQTTAGAAVGLVQVDPAQIEQVIMNLALNARDAMPQGGLLMITTAPAELSEDQARRFGSIDPGPCAILSVSDTGSGMDEETRLRVFEPFFTTKPVGKGTGLGLSMVYGIVEQHGGAITVESSLGHGTTFRIYLPRVTDVLSEPEGHAKADPAGRGSETILLVEDETEVRDLVAQMLQGSGYTVLTAPDPGTALALSDRHRGPIHLLLTDVVLPEMSGRELRQRLRESRPRTKVLYMSGYTDEALGRHGALEPDVVLLQKPFGVGELGRKIREILDAPGG